MGIIDNKGSLIAVSICLLTSACAIASESSSYPISVKLTLKQDQITPCGSIDFNVTVINSGSDFPVEIPTLIDFPHHWLQIELISPAEEKLQYRGPEIQLAGVDSKVVLYPGYRYGTSLTLSCDYFDMSAIGRYRLKVTYGKGPTPSRNLDRLAQSNEVVFKVVSKDPI